MRIERVDWDGADPRGLADSLRARAGPDGEVDDETARIVARVREEGDAALRELTAELDAIDRRPEELALRVDEAELESARGRVDPGLIAALEVASRNINAVARSELEAMGAPRVRLAQGQSVSIRSEPVAAAGVYAPGGRAAYPSSVLMCSIPARVAGVDRVAVASPPGPDGRLAPIVLAACRIAGIEDVYAIGGAQAIAAFAYGTETVPAVDVVAGPGNRFVNSAKRLAYGRVAIDGIAGPTELVVLLDAGADSRFLALDLLAQAEHGPDGFLAAISAERDVLDALSKELTSLATTRASVGVPTVTLVTAPDLSAAVELADAIAPEHLELAVDVADARLAGDRIAGCVFFGPFGAVAFGDYAAGSNHVLPTGGAARFGGPLGVATFRRRTSVVEVPPEAADGLAPRVAALARAEGFPVHGESAEARTGD
jgi:histidinol dehydrogenase